MLQHCCDANTFFDAKEARKKVKAFRKKGARAATRKLIKMMKPGVRYGQSLLDVGGGIGAIGLELKDISTYTLVDASSAYQDEARNLFKEYEWKGERLKFVNADFVDEAEDIPVHHHVTLDKVICCYPDMVDLLTSAAGHTSLQLGLVYPISGWVPSAFQSLANFYFRLKNSAFRTYLHKPDKVAELLQNLGFELKKRSYFYQWQIDIWQRGL